MGQAERTRRTARRKPEMARTHPRESRLVANEIVQGAPRIGAMLSGRLRALETLFLDGLRPR